MRSHVKTSSTRLKRARLLLQLLAMSALGSSVAVAADSDANKPSDDILVTTFAEDCCPPQTTVVPNCPPIYYGPGMSSSQGLAAPGQNVAPATPPSSGNGGATTGSGAQVPQPLNNSAGAAAAPFAANAGDFDAAPRSQSFASTSGSRGGLNAPNMLGDLVGVQSSITVFDSLLPLGPPLIDSTTAPNVGNRRFKIAENVSPIPQDRVYFNFNSYNDALQQDGTFDKTLNRYSFGGEKTFAEGLFSIEMRMAIADGFKAEQTSLAGLSEGAEFGNLQFAFKNLLYTNGTTSIGSGLTLAVPTARDVSLTGFGSIENETVFIAPFIGFLTQPSENTFFQGFMQTDIALGGDRVVDAATGTQQGVFQEQNFLYVSGSMGHWLYKNRSQSALVNGLAGIAELHYSTSLNDADTISVDDGANLTVIAGPGRVDYLNATAGIQINSGLTNIRIAGGAPLRNGDNQNYQGELLFQVNRRF